MTLRDRMENRVQQAIRAVLQDEPEDQADRLIREAQEQGAFDNLEGEGRPLSLEDNPFEDPEMRLAHKVLVNAGMCPPWLELMKEIDAEVESTQRVWANYARHRRGQMTNVHRGTVLRFAETVNELDATRNRTLGGLRKRWEEINRKIQSLNSLVPSQGFTRTPIQIEKKSAEFEREFPLLAGTLNRL